MKLVLLVKTLAILLLIDSADLAIFKITGNDIIPDFWRVATVEDAKKHRYKIADVLKESSKKKIYLEDGTAVVTKSGIEVAMEFLPGVNFHLLIKDKCVAADFSCQGKNFGFHIDSNNHCESLALKGGCEKDPVTMYTQCFEVCSGCIDRLPSCPKLVKQGMCEKDTVSMHRNCCDSCKKKTGCTNKHKLCKFWASVGECENNGAYMYKVCCQACNSCTDRHKQCKFWASKDECVKNAVWMLPNCCHSCQGIAA